MTTLTHTIYGPGPWSLQAFHSDPRRVPLLDWLTANGIDVRRLPIEQVISVDVGEQGSVIRYTAYVVDESGSLIASDKGTPVFEAHTVPLTVDPPDELRPDTWPAPAEESRPPEQPGQPATLRPVQDPAQT